MFYWAYGDHVPPYLKITFTDQHADKKWKGSRNLTMYPESQIIYWCLRILCYTCTSFINIPTSMFQDCIYIYIKHNWNSCKYMNELPREICRTNDTGSFVSLRTGFILLFVPRIAQLLRSSQPLKYRTNVKTWHFKQKVIKLTYRF